VVFVAGVLALAAASATANGPLTWSGASTTDANWSDGTNWGGSAPSNPVTTLSFPSLTSCASPATCYTSSNDVSGLSADAIALDDGAGHAGSGYHIFGDSITLGAGGFTASTAGSSRLLTNFGIPLTLSASQTWSIDDNALVINGAVAGGSHALTLDTALNGELIVGANIEASTVALGGTVALYGDRAAPEGQINGTTGNAVSVDDSLLAAADNGGTSGIGQFTTSDGSIVYIGDEGGIAGQLMVNGGATFDPSSTLSLAYGGAGTTAGTDYSQLSATGSVDLGGASLELYGSVPSGGGSACVPLTVGNVATLVTTTGTLSGTFNGIPDGTVVPIGCQPASGTAGTVQINYTANTVTATVITAATTTPPPPPPPPPPPGTRKSATQVDCYDTNPGAPGDYFQCTADVGDASSLSPADVPGGSVQFAVNAGGGGGFQGSSTCDLVPSQTGGPDAFCSVNYVPPTGGIAIGSQPPITATYSGSSVFASSSGQPQTLQAIEASLCSAVYDPVCATFTPLPTTLADLCVSLGTTCLPGAQGDGTQNVTLDPDANSLVVNVDCPGNTPASGDTGASGTTSATESTRQNPVATIADGSTGASGQVLPAGLTACELQAYLNGTASQDVVDRVQYQLNYNSYVNDVNLESAEKLNALQVYFAQAAAQGGYNQTAANVLSLAITQGMKQAYAQVAVEGTDTSNVGVILPTAWCASTENPATCLNNMKEMQEFVDDSFADLANTKLFWEVNAPFKPSTPKKTSRGSAVEPAQAGHRARTAKTKHLPSIVLAESKTVKLAAGQQKRVSLPISKAARTELKQLWRKGIHTLHAKLYVQLVDANGDYTTRTIPVTIHLAKPKKKHH
jgi:hypothetical protein